MFPPVEGPEFIVDDPLCFLHVHVPDDVKQDVIRAVVSAVELLNVGLVPSADQTLLTDGEPAMSEAMSEGY